MMAMSESTHSCSTKLRNRLRNAHNAEFVTGIVNASLRNTTHDVRATTVILLALFVFFFENDIKFEALKSVTL